MAKIQPIEFPILGTANELTVQFNPFDAEATSCMVYYTLRESNTDAESGLVTSKQITQGNYTLTEEEYAAWGADNMYVVQLIADHLGVVLIAE